MISAASSKTVQPIQDQKVPATAMPPSASCCKPVADQNPSVKFYHTRNQKGQIVVEYILLLIVAVTLAALISTRLVSRDPGNPGFLVSQWVNIINFIGQETEDDAGGGN